MSEPTQLSALLARLETDALDEREAEYRAMVEGQARIERAERLRRCGVGLTSDVRDAIVAGTLNPASTKALRAVARWRQAGGDYPLLVLTGGVGTGKSVAAAWWLADCGGLLRPMSAVARAWDSPTHGAAVEREAVCGCAGLALDDVGTELQRQIAAVGAAMREVLDARQSARTIVTTNLTREQMVGRYDDERLTSRLARAAWITCDGADLRRREVKP